MLPSAAFDGSKGRTSVLGLQLTRCEGQRDLVFARARETAKRHDCRGGARRTGILKPLTPCAARIKEPPGRLANEGATA
jgi:hypothetical protein